MKWLALELVAPETPNLSIDASLLPNLASTLALIRWLPVTIPASLYGTIMTQSMSMSLAAWL
jgi:hypothetical protein